MQNTLLMWHSHGKWPIYRWCIMIYLQECIYIYHLSIIYMYNTLMYVYIYIYIMYNTHVYLYAYIYIYTYMPVYLHIKVLHHLNGDWPATPLHWTINQGMALLFQDSGDPPQHGTWLSLSELTYILYIDIWYMYIYIYIYIEREREIYNYGKLPCIVSFPSKNAGSFCSYVAVYRRVCVST